MSKDLTTTKGTIAYTLNENRASIFKLLNEGKMYEAKIETLRVLDADERLKKNPQLNACKAQMLKAQNANHFISIFCTYLTGCKVS